MSALLEETDVVIETKLHEPGDEDRFSHYCKKDAIMAAAIEGVPAIALCGKVWLPGRNPDDFPVCPECQEILDKYFPEDGK